MMLGIIAFVGEHGLDADYDGEGGEEQALEDERVDIGGSGHAGDRDAGTVHGDMILGAPLGPVRRVRAGEFAATLGTRMAWKWVLVSDRAVLHRIRPSRGRDVIDELMAGHRPRCWVADR